MEEGYLCDVPEVVTFGTDTKLNGQHGSLSSKESSPSAHQFSDVSKPCRSKKH